MSDLTTTRIFTDGEKGITAAKLNDIIGSSTIQPAFVSSKPVASSAAPTDNLLLLKSAGTYAQVPFQTVIDSVNAGLPSNDSEIWSVRLRSYNALGNPNFEVDQRNVGAGVVNIANGAFVCDRWVISKAGAHTLNASQENGSQTIPGLPYVISQKRMLLQLTVQESTLAAADYLQVNQTIEGPAWRELSGNPFSISLLVFSDVANLKFALSIRAGGGGSSLVKLCTIPNAGTWTLITLPNIPAPTTPFPVAPGGPAASISITLSCGVNFQTPADVWQSGNFFGTPGMSNWSASPVNSGFRVGFIQVEPGTVCSTFMDKPFTQNLDECLRYYQKTYDYLTKPGTVTNNGLIYVVTLPSQHLYGSFPFKRVMAKAPTMNVYDNVSGGIGAVRDNSRSLSVGVTGFIAIGDSSFSGSVINSLNTAAALYSHHYVADTGW